MAKRGAEPFVVSVISDECTQYTTQNLEYTYHNTDSRCSAIGVGERG